MNNKLTKIWNVANGNFVMEGKQVRCLKQPWNPLHITGTRFPAVLGFDRFKTPFETWCEMVRLVKTDFVENEYIRAGRIVEQKLVPVLKNTFTNLEIKLPQEVLDVNSNPYNYFPNQKIFGGMWDCLGENTMIEIKTTGSKNAKYWACATPHTVLYQAALYAYLSHCDNIMVCCSFLTEEDYKRPDLYRPVLGKYLDNKGTNTLYRTYSLAKIFPHFATKELLAAVEFWNNHVVTGISPNYTERDVATGLVDALEHRIANSSDLEKSRSSYTPPTLWLEQQERTRRLI